jgi:hypothetical protein
MENRVCLSHDVQVAGAAWRIAMRIIAGVGDLVHMTGNDRTGRVLGGRMIRRSGDAVCGLHRTRGDEEREFLRRFVSSLASKSIERFVSGLASKSVGRFVNGLASKPLG